MTTTSRLVDEITGESIQLTYDDADPKRCDGPIFTSSLDIGWPVARQTGFNQPNQNGFVDMTQFWGERTVAWSGYIAPSDDYPYPPVMWDKLRGLTAPARRPWLYYQEDGWEGERRLQLRGDTFQSPLTREFGPVIVSSVTWRAVNGGAQESAEERLQNISPSGISTGGACFTPPPSGACFDTSCGPQFTEGYIASTTVIVNKGNVVVYPMLIFTGSVQNPTIDNLTTNQKIGLTGTIAPNASIYIDTQNRTVRENNDPNLSRLSMYDFTKSTWLYLAPGANRLNYSFTGSAAGTCQMLMRDRWI